MDALMKSYLEESRTKPNLSNMQRQLCYTRKGQCGVAPGTVDQGNVVRR